MISIAGIVIVVIAILFVVIFVVVLISMIAGFLRMRGVANKVFTLAEQEMARKLQAGPTTPTAAAADPAVCSHCGGRVPTNVAQCPNCGAGVR